MTSNKTEAAAFAITRQGWKELVLSAVTVVYLVVALFWLMDESVLRTRMLEPVKITWLFWGLEQNWRLFSPSIRNINYHTVGIITRRNGFRELWEPPRMERLDWYSKFTEEKFRKWSVDTLPWASHKEHWPYIARYIGRKVYDEKNPPVELTLCLQWTRIPKPSDAELVSRSKLPIHSHFNHVFTYKFQPEDFKGAVDDD